MHPLVNCNHCGFFVPENWVIYFQNIWFAYPCIIEIDFDILILIKKKMSPHGLAEFEYHPL